MASIEEASSFCLFLSPLKAVWAAPPKSFAPLAANPIFAANGNAAKNAGIFFYFTVSGLSVNLAETSLKFTKLFAFVF